MGWEDTDMQRSQSADGMWSWVQRGHIRYSIILSEDCEIDKFLANNTSGPLVAAPIVSLSLQPNQKDRDAIMGQKRNAFMPVTGIGSLGDAYIDLRLCFPMDSKVAVGSSKVASLGDEARNRLRIQIVSFFTRKKLAE